MPDKPITTADELVEYLFTNEAGERTRFLYRTEEARHSGNVYSHVADEDVLAKVNELVESVRRETIEQALKNAGLLKEEW